MTPHYRGEELHYFNKKIETVEGQTGVDDYKRWLSTNPSVEHLIQSEALDRAAQAIAEEKGRQGRSDHEDPRAIYHLISRFGKVEGKIGELMCLGGHSSEEIATYWLLDDGNASRSRRNMLLSGKYKHMGVGSAYHPIHEVITVVLLASNAEP